MPDETRHESQDLEDYETLDSYDTLDGKPGDDPLDRGVATPDRWSAGMRYGTTTEEEQEGESLDQLLDEEEPDTTLDDLEEVETENEDEPGSIDDDDELADEDVDGLLLDDGQDPRAGRLVAEDEGAHADAEADLVASDVGIDGGAATAEEAAVHVVDEDDYDIRSE